MISDLLADDLPLGQDDTDKDDLTILNEILNAPSTGGDDFSKEWQAVFGTMPLSTGATYTQGETDQAEFMPSNLLDLNKQMSGMSLSPSGGWWFIFFTVFSGTCKCLSNELTNLISIFSRCSICGQPGSQW